MKCRHITTSLVILGAVLLPRIATAQESCDLTSVAVNVSVDSEAELVTFDVSSDTSCSGTVMQISAMPSEQGVPILKNVELDASGTTSVVVELLGTRRAEQSWNVELIDLNTGGVATSTEFDVTGICPRQFGGELHATYLRDRDAVELVLTVDPACAGRAVDFIIAGSATGAAVDENGRIETTRDVVGDETIVPIEAVARDPDGGGWSIAQRSIDTSAVSETTSTDSSVDLASDGVTGESSWAGIGIAVALIALLLLGGGWLLLKDRLQRQ